MSRLNDIGIWRSLLRLPFLSVVLFAVLVSSIIPTGYMPSQGETWTITICTPDGVQDITVPIGDPEPHPDGDISHKACVFAGLAQLALHTNDTILPVLHVVPSSEPVGLAQLDFEIALHISPADARAPPIL